MIHLPKKSNSLKLVLFLIVLNFSNTLVAQKKYPSLLWEITGNGSSKPSYLYGTMHVSSKLAYHLSDSFFVALANVNVVGLESNPDQWLGNMKKLGMLEVPSNYNGNQNFYKDAFKINIPDNKLYAGILAYSPDLINGLLYRNNSYNEDHEESTYIDLFIYKTGSKLNKKIVSLEDFKTSMVMSYKASTRDPNEKYDASKKNIDYQKIRLLINDSYRNGDLDALDSLTKLSNNSKNNQKYLLDDRNIIMAHNIDSIIKTNALFSGIGAAHLPGDKGVIELLRKMGYKLRPILNIATKKGMKQKDAIEAIIKKVPSYKQVDSDSLFNYDLFEPMVQLNKSKGFAFSLATDMANGAYYTISRQKTYATLFNYKVPNMITKMDSLLYENIPGKITSRKDIISNTGIKGIDVTSLTKQGDIQRCHIYVLDNEVVVIKMAGKGKYVGMEEGTRFFNSIKFNAKPAQSNIMFSPKSKGFKVNIPSTYDFTINKKSGTQGLAEELYAFEPTENTSYGVMHYFYNDFDYLEEDTFELNRLCNSTLKNFDYTSNVNRQLTLEQKLPCIKFTSENKAGNKILNAKIIIKGVHYYLAYAITDKKNTGRKSKDFLESFLLTDYVQIFPTPVVTDDDYSFTVKDEAGDAVVNLINEDLKGFYKEIEDARESKKYNTDFLYKSSEKSYYSPSSAEHVSIYYEKYNDYDYRNPEKYWKELKEYIKKSTSFNLTKYDVKTTDNLQTADVILKDTACTNIIKRKYILKDGILFCLSAVCDSINGTTGWTESFLNTFRHKDTVYSKPIFQNKISLLLKDLSSADSSVKYAAKESLNANGWDKIYAKDILAYYNSADFLKLDEDSRSILLVSGGTLDDEKIIPIYKNLYAKYADSSYMQICILKGLGYLKTKNSYNAIYDLLKNQTPLTGDETQITNIFSPLYDSLELCKNYFPGLFSLSSFDEYKNPIKQLLTDLVVRKIVAATQYTTQLAVLISEANNELKRYNSNSSKNNSKLTNNDFDYETEIANALAEATSSALNGATNNEATKTSYPTYYNMIENYAVILAPHYQTTPAVKQYFDKLFKVKKESILLNIALIANEYKIPVTDTLWRFFSNNPKTKIKTYNELTKIKQLDKFDKKNLTQLDFCKTVLDASISLSNYDEGNNLDLKVKEKPDSVYYFKKEFAKNRYENGTMYFFNRINAETKVKSLATVFVNEKDDSRITTNINVIDTKLDIEIGKTVEETVEQVITDFYFKYRNRYKAERTNSYLDYEGEY